MEYLQMAIAEDRLGQLRAQADQERLARSLRSSARRRTLWSESHRSFWSAFSPAALRARLGTSECTTPAGAPCGA